MSAKTTEARRLLAVELKPYISRIQRAAMIETLMLRNGDAEEMARLTIAVADRIRNSPKTYDQDGKGKDAVVHLHYFGGSYDAWITELDMTDGVSQAYGLCSFAGIESAEFGYVSITELLKHNMELDLHWDLKTVKELK